jgi:glycerol-3-phosphate dehydrogenase
LIEAGDFAGQTSSASTKLVHGGVRYLQQAVASLDYGQFQMVRKALRERIHMLRAAPYLARRLELLVPCFSRWQMFYFGVGMTIYDWIAGRSHLGPSRQLGREATARTLPALRMEGVAGSVTYYDGQFDDARYAIAMAQTFTQHGGELVNYARLIGFERDTNGKLSTAVVADQRSGETFRIHARVFVNCTGPFADEVRLLANPALPRRLRLSKGIHILLPVEPLKSQTALLIPETEDGRVIFAIPWFGSLLVGTTEDEIEHGIELAANRQEIEYLLKYVNRYLKTEFTLADVQASFAGARPLVVARSSNSAKTVDTKKLVRDHEVEIDASSGLISILGGKWTTYRAMAEDGIHHAMRALAAGQSAAGIHAVTPAAIPVSKSLETPLTGSTGYHDGYAQELAAKFDLPATTAAHLAEKFGTDAPKVLALIEGKPELAQPLCTGTVILCAEALYCIRNEMAESIEDVLARRVGLQFHNWKLATAAAPAVGTLLASERDWSPQQTAEAVESYRNRLDRLARIAAGS